MRKPWAVAAAVVVFISEILAVGSFMLWGSSVSDSWWVPYALLLASLVVWNQVALRAEAARVVLYALAILAVFAAGHPTLGLVEAGVFVVALTLARVPEVQALITRARGVATTDDPEQVSQPG